MARCQMFALVLALTACGPTPTGKPAATTTAAAAVDTTPSIPYVTVARWSPGQRAGSSSEVIAIDPAYANDADLRRLGEQLHRETPPGNQRFVEVYADSVSATRYQQGHRGTLPKTQQRRFDRAWVGDYTHNPVSHWDKWGFATRGLTPTPAESIVTVDYEEAGR